MLPGTPGNTKMSSWFMRLCVETRSALLVLCTGKPYVNDGLFAKKELTTQGFDRVIVVNGTQAPIMMVIMVAIWPWPISLKSNGTSWMHHATHQSPLQPIRLEGKPMVYIPWHWNKHMNLIWMAHACYWAPAIGKRQLLEGYFIWLAAILYLYAHTMIQFSQYYK